MDEVLRNPSRLTKSSYLFENDPNTVKTELTRAMEKTKTRYDISVLLILPVLTVNL